MALDLNNSQGQQFGPAGANHAPGLVPDPGSTSHSPPYFLGDDGAFHTTAAINPQIPFSGSLFSNAVPPAIITRLDRLLISAASVNSGDNPPTTRDWLETLIGGTTSFAQFASISPQSAIGVLGASRTSDGTADALGNTGFVNNNAASGQGWAFYGEAWNNNNSATFTTVFELDIVNKVVTLVSIDPFNIAPGGETAALWVASGGSRSGATTASAAMVILNNGAAFDKGIIVQSGALVSGSGLAIAMPSGYQIGWFTSAGVLGPTINASGGGLNLGHCTTVGNGTVGPMTMGSAGPAGSNAGVQEWLKITNTSGIARYIPCF